MLFGVFAQLLKQYKHQSNRTFLIFNFFLKRTTLKVFQLIFFKSANLLEWMESLVPLPKIIFPRLPVFTHDYTSIHKHMHQTQSLKLHAAYQRRFHYAF